MSRIRTSDSGSPRVSLQSPSGYYSTTSKNLKFKGDSPSSLSPGPCVEGAVGNAISRANHDKGRHPPLFPIRPSRVRDVTGTSHYRSSTPTPLCHIKSEKLFRKIPEPKTPTLYSCMLEYASNMYMCMNEISSNLLFPGQRCAEAAYRASCANRYSAERLLKSAAHREDHQYNRRVRLPSQ